MAAKLSLNAEKLMDYMVKTRLHNLVEVAVAARLTPKETDAAVEELLAAGLVELQVKIRKTNATTN